MTVPVSMPDPLMPEIDFAMDAPADLHERLAQLREVGPIVPVKCYGKSSWLILDFKDVDHVFRDKDVFDITRYNVEIAEPIIGRTLLAMKDREHKLNRGLMNPSVSFGKVRSYVEAIIEPTVNELLDKIEGKAEVDIKKEFCAPFPFNVITKLLGIPVEDEAKLTDLASRMMTYPIDPEGASAAIKDFDIFIEPVIEARRKNPSDDLISLLLQAELDGDKLSHEAILVFLRTLYPAGGHSTSLNIATAVYCMLANPEAREMVAEGDKAAMSVVQEALRWEAALGLLPRILAADTELHGVKMYRDQMVYISVTAANDDPKVFPEPRQFNARRTNLNSLLTFGRHEHICLGRHLAMREIEVALRVLVKRFPNMELIPGREPVFSGSFFRSCDEIWVRPAGSLAGA